MPQRGAKNSAPAMMDRLYKTGAAAGSKNSLCALRMPITMPLTANTAGVNSIKRINDAVNTWRSGAKPYPTVARTSGSAKIAARMHNAATITKTKLMTWDAKRQLPRTSPSVNNLENGGMNADANAPPATRLNNKSGMRNAATYASSCAEVPN
ncbi:MAG: hypothetical protein HDKAJFGB_02246 [Anaerolineae bacterium]|nr:hypothetical protein [Anaerolineae bacterium]